MLDCARHDRAAADPKNQKFWVAKILVPGIVTKEHQTVWTNQ
jgi:hypothetical protein